MKTYAVTHYHTQDSSPSVIEFVKGYREAVRIMKQIAKSWERLSGGTVVKDKDRIEFRAFNGKWGCAVYVVEETETRVQS